MKNRGFQNQGQKTRQRKLDATLRQLTEDRLSRKQRDAISRAIGSKWQYRLQVHADLGAFCREVDPKKERDGQTMIQTLFGDIEHLSHGAPMATVVRRFAPGARMNSVHIYLPKKEEDSWDDTRKEETAEP